MLVNKDKKHLRQKKNKNPDGTKKIKAVNESQVLQTSLNTAAVNEEKVDRKRKLSSGDENENKKAKISKHLKVDSEEDENDNSEDDEVNVKDIKPVQGRTEQQIINHKAKIAREEYNAEKILQLKQENKAKKEEGMKGVKEMFIDTPRLESESLKEQIYNRLIQRMKKTIVMNNIPNKFKTADVKALIPDMVSCMIPYSLYYHKVGGTAYIDVDTSEKAIKIADQLRNTEIKGKKPFAMVQTKIVDDVDKYNCQRLVISNLSSKTTLQQLKDVMPTASRIEMLPVKGIDRQMTMTAFAQYASVEEAIADYDSKHGTVINENPINIKFQIRNDANIKDKQSNFDKKRLAVMGLNKNTPMEELKRCFPKSSEIRPSFDKGMAHICYATEKDCAEDKALLNMHKPPAKWRISYASGSTKTKTSERTPKTEGKPKKWNDVAKKDLKKFEKKEHSEKKFRGNERKTEGNKIFRNKQSPEQIQSKTKIDKPLNTKSGSANSDAVAKNDRKTAKKNDKSRQEKRKSKKEKRRLLNLKNAGKLEISKG